MVNLTALNEVVNCSALPFNETPCSCWVGCTNVNFGVVIPMMLLVVVMCYLIEPIIFPKVTHSPLRRNIQPQAVVAKSDLTRKDKRRKRKWKMQN